MTNTRVYKHPFNGWTAETSVPLDGVTIEGNPAALRIATLKGSSRLISSTATAVGETDTGFVFRMFQDFRKTVLNANGRATEKSIREQHEAALAYLPHLIEQAKAHTLAIDAA